MGATILKFEDTKENREKLLALNLYDKIKGTDGDIITVYGYSTRFNNLCLVVSQCEFDE